MIDSEREAAVGALVAAVQALADYQPPDWDYRMNIRQLARWKVANGINEMTVPAWLLADVVDALARVEATEAKEADRA